MALKAKAGPKFAHPTGSAKRGKAEEEKTNKEMEAKFNTAYLIAKDERPFTKFQPIISL